MASVPIAYFDYRELAPAKRLAAFRQMTSAVYEVHAVGNPEAFNATARGYRVGALVFNEAILSPARFRRGSEHTSGADSDFLVLQAQLRGNERLDMSSGIVHVVPGNIYLRDWSFPFQSDATAMHLHSVLIPRNRLNRITALNEQNPVLAWPLEEPEGGLLFHLWSELLDRLPNITLRQAATLTDGFLGFIDGLLSDETGPGDSGLLQSMEQFLQRHLRENISVADLCRQFHVSRATVYRRFEPHGGVRGFIDRARLERVRIELLHTDPTRAKVAEIAASWGFFGAASFSRRFRKRFGQTPSQALNEKLETFPTHLSNTLEGSASFQAYTKWLDTKGRGVG